MPNWHRRTILATGLGLSAGSGVASLGIGRGDSTGTGLPDVARLIGVAWRYDGPFAIDTTVVADGRIYTQTGGRVYALDAADGSLVWETDDIGAEGTPAVVGDTLYVAGDPIRVIDAETGGTRWESVISSHSLAVGHGMVYAASDHVVYGLDGDDGSVQWERESVTVETGDGEETAEELQLGDVAEEAVYVFDPEFASGRGGMFAGLDPATGETTVTVDHDEAVTQLVAGSGHVATVPAYDATQLFDMATQEVVASTSSTLTHTITGDAYFALGEDGNLSAYDLSGGGARAWTVESSIGLPELVGDTVVTAYGPDRTGSPDGGDEDRVMAYDLQTGEEVWRYTFDGRTWPGPAAQVQIAADANTVYVERDGELLALRSEEETPADEMEAEIEIGEDVEGKFEITSHSFERIEGIGTKYCSITVDGRNVTEREEITVSIRGSLVGGEYDTDAASENQLTLEPGESSSATIGLLDCRGGTGYRITVEATDVRGDGDDEGSDDGEGTDESETDDSSEGSSDGGQQDRNESGGGTDGDDGDGDETGGESGGDAETGTDAAGDGDDGTDTVPGFTTGTGVVAGALGLEWLRRRAETDGNAG